MNAKTWLNRFGTVLAILVLGCSAPLAAQEEPEVVPDSPPAMTGDRLGELLLLVDPNAEIDGSSVRFTIAERPHFAIFDETADRMRLMTPIAPVDILGEALMYRMLQANYDSALDVRYATAQNLIWSIFVHPLSSLNGDFLASALRQVHTAAETFGTTFSSGELIYGGGDSQEQLEELEEALRELTNPTT
ncbi:MAG: hypothetical protein RQ741_05940 [Wenzhouxiangellaceae bacterium]|nr:hypothetical protein [Wenzhouxiangellaceae bacterium]